MQSVNYHIWLFETLSKVALIVVTVELNRPNDKIAEMALKNFAVKISLLLIANLKMLGCSNQLFEKREVWV